MQRIKLILEYDGSGYHGFQVQKNAHTVQAELEQAISRLNGEKTAIMFAGRTDAGVHAMGQVVAFDSASSIPPDKWQFALNSFLPPDIRVHQSGLTRPDFHPRFDALCKRYRYLIYRNQAESVFYRDRALINDEKLDLAAMNEACAFILGRHDFRSFCASGSSVKTYKRTVYHCILRENGSLLQFEIEADGFLYNMVRIIVGTLLNVGRGIYPARAMQDIITSHDRSQAGPTAPPQGLYLLQVTYPEEGEDDSTQIHTDASQHR